MGAKAKVSVIEGKLSQLTRVEEKIAKLDEKYASAQKAVCVCFVLLLLFCVCFDDPLSIAGADTTVIKHIRLAKLPADTFLATIMEWVEPLTEHRGAERLNAMTISVPDVEKALEQARSAGALPARRTGRALLELPAHPWVAGQSILNHLVTSSSALKTLLWIEAHSLPVAHFKFPIHP